MWTLKNSASGEYVLCVQSTWFKQITQYLERLELDNYINVTFNDSYETMTAYLRRYNLRFSLNLDENKIASLEYPGYNVSTNQKTIGTLVGLQHGLLIENEEKRLILMPHATIKCSIGKNDIFSHQYSSLCLSENLRQPPCFTYEMDDVLQRLKPHNSKSAWLYLAALHAVTSSSYFTDPFTELTGTEMAVQILQSACVWSCCPYDEESLTTLNFIRKLSQKRKWYDRHLTHYRNEDDKGLIESIRWPQGVPTMVAFDGYDIIADKLIEDSENLAMLHRPSTSESIKRDENSVNKASEHLGLRSYLRNLSMYNFTTKLEYPKYFGKVQQALIVNQGEGTNQLQLRASPNKVNLLSMQYISFALISKSIKPLKDSELYQKNNLSDFLVTKNSLEKAYPPITIKDFDEFNNLFNLDIRFSWLKLYNMAISCFVNQEDIQMFKLMLAAAA